MGYNGFDGTHPPAIYRVTEMVHNMPDFGQAFSCHDGEIEDSMHCNVYEYNQAQNFLKFIVCKREIKC